MDSNQDLNMVAQPSDDPTGAAVGLGSTQQQNESEYQAQRRALQQQAQPQMPVEQQQQPTAQQQQGPTQPAAPGAPPVGPDPPGGLRRDDDHDRAGHLRGPGLGVERCTVPLPPPLGKDPRIQNPGTPPIGESRDILF